ncbi:MAG: hypothetical protein KF862_08440 [Chitinophagaceae bacterium]|nr:hypothetical protein [Chitinophagaceae bacterium]
MHKKDLILNPFFITGLIILVLNDLYLKQQYGNYVTGKLSDFAGLLVFPLFVAAIFHRSKRWISFATGLGFILWKSPLADPVIEAVNQLSFVTVGRIADYSDFMAVPVLLLSHYIVNHAPHYKTRRAPLIIITRTTLLIISFFAFCATTIPRPREIPQGTIYIGKTYTIKMPKDSIIHSIKAWGYNCDFHPADSTTDTDRYYHRPVISYYQTNNIIIQDEYAYPPDTILNVKYTLREIKPGKTQIEIINVTLSNEGQIQNWRRLKALSKYYKKLVKKGFIEKID